MKKRILFLLPLFLGACSDSGESPVITIEKLYVSVDADNGDNHKNYANNIDQLPALKVGDKVDALLVLDGNGAELQSFKLLNDTEEVKTELHYEKGDVTTEGNLTDEENGQLRFKDGVTKTKILVRATVDVDKNGDVQLSFYLSSKAECEGAQEVIGLKTEVDDKKKQPDVD